MFKFRLQRILELREQAEQAKARELASAQESAEHARRTRDELAQLHANSRTEVDAAHRSEPRVGHLQQLGLVLQSLDQRLESADETVRAADAVVADAQSLLESAARDRSILDRLKDRHTDQWRVEAAHKDRVGMDEIALARFSRQAASSSTQDTPRTTSGDPSAPESPTQDGTKS